MTQALAEQDRFWNKTFKSLWKAIVGLALFSVVAGAGAALLAHMHIGAAATTLPPPSGPDLSSGLTQPPIGSMPQTPIPTRPEGLVQSAPVLEH